MAKIFTINYGQAGPTTPQLNTDPVQQLPAKVTISFDPVEDRPAGSVSAASDVLDAAVTAEGTADATIETFYGVTFSQMIPTDRQEFRRLHLVEVTNGGKLTL